MDRGTWPVVVHGITELDMIDQLTFSFSLSGVKWSYVVSAYQFSSVAQSYPTLYHHMDCSMPGFPIYHQIPELAQIHKGPSSQGYGFSCGHVWM